MELHEVVHDRRHLASELEKVVSHAVVTTDFRPDVIRTAVWLYLRFTLGYRDVESLLAERGLTVSRGARQ
jgi:transposase-like protein